MKLYDSKYEVYRHSYNPYLLDLVPHGMKVLDIGCSGGQLGEQLTLKKKCIVYGVDISENAIADARNRIHAAKRMNIEQDAFPFTGELFDIIILGDVLEHLRDPVTTLCSFKRYLGPEGLLLVSVPNVAHISIRMRLLLGRWDYKQSGILDDSHLRFFTLCSAKKLLNEAGFEIAEFKASPKPNTRVSRHMPYMQRGIQWICKLLPKLFGYQFLFLCRYRQEV